MILHKLQYRRCIVKTGILLSLILICRNLIPSAVSSAPESMILHGHTDSVSSIDVSQNGRLIASASHDHTVRLWNAESGKIIRVLSGHTDEIYAVAFSPDNQTLASSDYRGQIFIWSVELDKPLRILQIKGWSTAIAFSTDGKQLAVASQEPVTTIFDPKTGNILRTLETKGYINAVAFSPDDRYLATADRTIMLWNLKTEKADKLFQGHQGMIRAFAFSKDGRLMASGSNDKTVRLWNVKTGEAEKIFQTETPIEADFSSKPLMWKMPFTGVSFSSDGKILATATGRAIHLWDISTGKNFQTLEGHRHSVTSVRFLPDNKTLVTGSLDNTVRIWSLQ